MRDGTLHSENLVDTATHNSLHGLLPGQIMRMMRMRTDKKKGPSQSIKRSASRKIRIQNTRKAESFASKLFNYFQSQKHE